MTSGPNYEKLFLDCKLQKFYHEDIIRRYCLFFGDAAPDAVAFYQKMLEEETTDAVEVVEETEETTE